MNKIIKDGERGKGKERVGVSAGDPHIYNLARKGASLRKCVNDHRMQNTL